MNNREVYQFETAWRNISVMTQYFGHDDLTKDVNMFFSAEYGRIFTEFDSLVCFDV